MSEAVLHEHVADYLKLQYRGIIYRTDFAAGIKMTVGQARRHKRLQQGRAYPDLFVAAMRHGFGGLYIELKATTIYKKDGITLLKDDHVEEQAATLELLRAEGYAAHFAVGFDEAQKIIDDYLK